MARYLAIDWDQNHLHLVAANVRGSKVKIEQIADWQLDVAPPLGDPETLGKMLRDRLKQTGIASAPVIVSLARERVIVKDIRFPPVPEAEEANLVRFQAVKELTDSAEDVVIDYARLTDRSAPEQRVMAVVVRKDIITAYQSLCQAAGLRLMGVAPRPFGSVVAAQRAMSVGGALTPKPDPANAAVAVVTLGTKWAEFCVLRGDTLVLARTLAIGPALAPEIRRNITVFNGQTSKQALQAIYLSSGFDPDLRKRLGELIELPIYPFDPFAGAEVDVPGNPGGFAGATGLLFSLGANGRLPVNFIEPRKAEVIRRTHSSRLLVGVGLGICVAVLLFVFGQIVLAGMEREANESDADKVRIERETAATLEDGKRLRAIDETNPACWPDELYDLTDRMDRIPNVYNFRITRVEGGASPPVAGKQYTGQLVVDGEYADPIKGRTDLDDFIGEFRNYGETKYYQIPNSPEIRSPERGDRGMTKFRFIVQITKRPPAEYTRKLRAE